MQYVFMKRWHLVASLITLLVLGVGLARDQMTTSTAQAAPSTSRTSSVLGHPDGAISDVVARVLPSVVNISTTTRAARAHGPARVDPFFNHPRSPFRGEPGRRYGNSLGSGVIVSADGYVVTNSHVVSGADEIKVSLSDGREYTAELVGSDPKSDLAVLELDGEVRGLQPIEVGRSADMRLGDVVLAIGNPFGVGQAVTMGIVSAKGRTGMGIVDYEDFIQTDAAINPGNSGGALINMKGQLIGINTAILSRTGGYQGIGFAIPTDMMAPIMKELIADGRVDRGWLGVDIRTVDRELARAAKLPDVRGAFVAAVVPGSPAERAGLQIGDVVVRIDGQDVESSGKLRNAVAMAGPGKTVALDVLRAGANQRIDVELGDRATVRLPRRR